MNHSWRKVDVWQRKATDRYELRESFIVLASGPMAAVDIVARQMGYTAAEYTGTNPKAILRDEGVVANTFSDLLQGRR